MKWNEITGEIDKVKRIVEGWSRTQGVRGIEKDIVLDKLRAVYDAVKFADVLNEEVSTDMAETEITEAAPQPETVAAEPREPKTEKVKNDRKKLLSLYGDAVPEDTATGTGHDAGHFQAPHTEAGQGMAAVPEPIGSPAYEDAPGSEGGGGADVLAAIGLAETMIEPDGMDADEEPAAPKAAVPGTHAEPYKKVLGDTIQSGETLADIYARNNNEEDVAGRIKNGKITSIRGVMGINDKFLVMRDLFDGDSAVYEKTMTELDGFAELDDALLYIHDNFTWNPDSDGAKMLIDLLTRKLS